MRKRLTSATIEAQEKLRVGELAFDISHRILGAVVLVVLVSPRGAPLVGVLPLAVRKAELVAHLEQFCLLILPFV